jgi:putative ribosome biogenesis GTPase RsgA
LFQRRAAGTAGEIQLIAANVDTLFIVTSANRAGTAGEIQLIAANVDTLFIVTSANRDFNVARLERYLAIAHDAGAFPV